jgi:hypothetical protein
MPMLFAVSSTSYVLLGALYFALLVSLGILCIRKGHWVMFIVGIFLPLFWIIGAVMPPTRAAVEAR